MSDCWAMNSIPGEGDGMGGGRPSVELTGSRGVILRFINAPFAFKTRPIILCILGEWRSLCHRLTQSYTTRQFMNSELMRSLKNAFCLADISRSHSTPSHFRSITQGNMQRTYVPFPRGGCRTEEHPPVDWVCPAPSASPLPHHLLKNLSRRFDRSTVRPGSVYPIMNRTAIRWTDV